MTSQTNPTAEANPDSLHDLFKADPENLSDKDIDTIVAHYREKRFLFFKEENMKKEKPKKATKEAPKNLSLDDLLL